MVITDNYYWRSQLQATPLERLPVGIIQRPVVQHMKGQLGRHTTKPLGLQPSKDPSTLSLGYGALSQ
jgi:hypothetical protein